MIVYHRHAPATQSSMRRLRKLVCGCRGIHVFRPEEGMDDRDKPDKPGHDELKEWKVLL
jgi:hypothetical protein